MTTSVNERHGKLAGSVAVARAALESVDEETPRAGFVLAYAHAAAAVAQAEALAIIAEQLRDGVRARPG